MPCFSNEGEAIIPLLHEEKISSDKSQSAGIRVLAYASGAAAVSGVLKFFIPLPAIDVAPLTLITKTMCDDISTIYGYKSLRGLSTFTAVLVGAANGMKLATEVTSFIPVAGAGANAVAAFSLHALTDFGMIICFELLDAGELTEEQIGHSPVGLVNRILGVTTDVVASVVRGGNIAQAIDDAKKEFLIHPSSISMTPEQQQIFKDFIK